MTEAAGPSLVDDSAFRIDGSASFDIHQAATRVEPLYDGKRDYRAKLRELRAAIDSLQSLMYAHDRYGLLVVFQGMDSAGKDSTIRKVFSGVNPHGLMVHAFGRPSERELQHDYMWRTSACLPERGRIGIFNRSYYEEVLVVRVHPGILTDNQRLPSELSADLETVWERRYREIRDFERYLHDNGIRVVKFFLHLSREEQRKRFLRRIDRPDKNWKFSSADVDERSFWDDYMLAFERCINSTSTRQAPWYCVPADSKRNMRLVVASQLLNLLRGLDMEYPDGHQSKTLQACRERLLGEKGADGD
jgi:PPK2 family polyphosphate:nucleotide phosphotransferase